MENTEVGGNGIAPALGFRAHKPVRLRVTAESTRRRKLVQWFVASLRPEANRSGFQLAWRVLPMTFFSATFLGRSRNGPSGPPFTGETRDSAKGH